VTTLAQDDHVIPLYTPECRQCKFCLSRKTNLCQKIRATQGKGLMPDGTSRFSLDGKPLLHYMGTSTFSNYIVVPRSRWRRSAPTRRSTSSATSAAASPPASARCSSRPRSRPGANVVVFGLGGIGLNVIQGAKLVGANRIIGVDLNPAREAMARKFGMTDFVNPKDVANVVDEIVRLTDGGADYSFECIGNTQTMRQALECCHKGWGQSIIIGVAPAGARSRPGRSSSSPAGNGKARHSAARAAAATCRRSSTGTWTARSPSTTSSPIGLKLDDINRGFELMKSGESIRSGRRLLTLCARPVRGHPPLTAARNDACRSSQTGPCAGDYARPRHCLERLPDDPAA
jgi:S-(hydroxymethyl)glutathione dehydrogenase/alcohol dehydrogenase